MQKQIMKDLNELPKLYSTESKPKEKILKIFNPFGIGTWHLIEYNPESQLAFGMCELQCKELGYVYIPEVFDAIPHIEKDLHFSGKWKDISPH